jgi:hypothetical protein
MFYGDIGCGDRQKVMGRVGNGWERRTMSYQMNVHQCKLCEKACIGSQRHHVSKAEAYGIWARSKDYGNAFHGNVDDGTINNINNKNIKAQVIFSHCPLLFKSLS